MTARIIIAALVLVQLTSCKEQAESTKRVETVEINERRELTMHDVPKAPIIPVMPPEWRQVPGTQIRVFNYRFGKSGEVFISNARGGILQYVNRWSKQYGKPSVTAVSGLPKIKVLEEQGVLVEATGRFVGGMGKLPRDNAGLLGAVIGFSDDILTIKMIGSAEEVAAEKERFITFCESIKRDKSVSSGEPSP